MRKRALRVAALLALALFAGGGLARADELQPVVSGKDRSPIYAWRGEKGYFIGAKDAAELYGGQLYWFPVAGRLRMSFRGRALQFLVDSASAEAEGGKKFKLDSPVMLRSSVAIIPLSFFMSREFSEWIGLETRLSGREGVLTIDALASVGPVRWFSYPDRTRIVVETAPGISYHAAARGVLGVEITFPLGTLEGAEQGALNDGLVDSFTLKQEAKVARLAVALSQKGAKWKAIELENPRRVVLDIGRPDGGLTGPEVASGPAPERAEPVAAAPQPAVKTPVGKKKRRIVVDAGHGGKDPGTKGRRGTLEKDVNLAVALDLARLLREEDAFEVLLTRNDDTFIPLGDRSRLANEYDADLFVSIHCNSSPNPREQGFEIYFLSEKASDPEAARLAEIENSVLALEEPGEGGEAAPILMALAKTENMNAASELAALISKSLSRRVDMEARGVKQADFYVLRGTQSPAVLAELAFLSNKKEEAKLQSKRVRRRLTEGLYAGVLDYAKRQGWMIE